MSIAGNDVAIDSDRNLTLQSGSALAAQAGAGVSIAGNGVAIDSDGNLTLLTALGLLAQIGSTVSVAGPRRRVGGSATFDVAAASRRRSRPAARSRSRAARSASTPVPPVGPRRDSRDAIAGTAAPTGAVTGAITSGSATVCVG